MPANAPRAGNRGSAVLPSKLTRTIVVIFQEIRMATGHDVAPS